MLVSLFKTTQLTNARSLVKEMNLERITYKDDLKSIHLILIGLASKFKS